MTARARIPPRWALAFGAATVLTASVWYLARADTIGLERGAAPWLLVTGPVHSALLAFTLTLMLFGAIPAALAVPLLGRSPWTLGVGPGNVRRWLALLAIGTPVTVLAGYIGAHTPAMGAVYPLGGLFAPDPRAFALHAGGYLLYYLGFEYLFRGFLLMGTKDDIGPAAANLLQACLATAFHFGKPLPEMAAAFPGSLIFGWLTLYTGAIWPALGIHWVLGMAVDYFLIFGH